MSDLSYYQLLGVKPDASPVEIKTAYRRAARANHPDSGLPGAGALFPLIQEAWDTLGDDTKRAAYDRKMNGGPSSQAASGSRPPQSGEPEAGNKQGSWVPQQSPVKPQQTPWGDGNREDSLNSKSDEPGTPQKRDYTNVLDSLKGAPRTSLIKFGISAFLWLIWAALCFILIQGIGKDGVIFAFLAFFLTLGLTFLLARFSCELSPVYAFIFAAITLPLPVVGLVTTGLSPTSLIFIVPVVGALAAFGDHFLRRPLRRS